jgi:hypothetical protein
MSPMMLETLTLQRLVGRRLTVARQKWKWLRSPIHPPVDSPNQCLDAGISGRRLWNSQSLLLLPVWMDGNHRLVSKEGPQMECWYQIWKCHEIDRYGKVDNFVVGKVHFVQIGVCQYPLKAPRLEAGFDSVEEPNRHFELQTYLWERSAQCSCKMGFETVLGNLNFYGLFRLVIRYIVQLADRTNL